MIVNNAFKDFLIKLFDFKSEFQVLINNMGMNPILKTCIEDVFYLHKMKGKFHFFSP